MAWKIGIDTGGTFTDVLACNLESLQWRTGKIWSRHDEPGKMLQNAFEILDLDPADVVSIVFGTTIVTNALVENRLAKTALVTTAGFKDTLRIARQTRKILYDLRAVHRDPPAVEPELCFEVEERILFDGTIEVPIPEDGLAALTERIPGDCMSVAVAFLHAYKNPEHERMAQRVLSRRFDHVSISSEVSPEAREYERMSAVALNAGLLPMVEAFLQSMQDIYDGRRFFLFHSAGGVIPAQLAAKYPLTLAMSGPSAGVQAAAAIAGGIGTEQAISLDMGGTTTDCCLIGKSGVQIVSQARLGHYDVRQPMVAVESVGAGGGSIVSYEDEILNIGPRSAGAAPGPACYGKGGTEPTLTDAVALLGYFGAADALKRPIEIHRDLAAAAFAPIVARLGLPEEEVGTGVLEVCYATMARAIKAISMDKGVDARDCVLLAFGGAGPMFVGQLARFMGIRRAIVPLFSSSLSALGCLIAAPSLTRQRTVRLSQKEAVDGGLQHACNELEAALKEELAPLLSSNGVSALETELTALMRYSGQSHEIEVPIGCGTMDLSSAFESEHRRAYGFVSDDPWICEAVRVSVRASSNDGLAIPAGIDDTEEVAIEEWTSCFFPDSGWCRTRQYLRDSLHVGQVVNGPALILSRFATIVLPTDCRARVLEGGHMDIEISHG